MVPFGLKLEASMLPPAESRYQEKAGTMSRNPFRYTFASFQCRHRHLIPWHASELEEHACYRRVRLAPCASCAKAPPLPMEAFHEQVASSQHAAPCRVPWCLPELGGVRPAWRADSQAVQLSGAAPSFPRSCPEVLRQPHGCLKPLPSFRFFAEFGSLALRGAENLRHATLLGLCPRSWRAIFPGPRSILSCCL